MSAVRQILGDPVTTHMRRDPTRISSGLSVAGALDAIASQEIGGRVVYFYVVDADERLLGVIPGLRWTPPRSPVRTHRRDGGLGLEGECSGGALSFHRHRGGG